MRCDVGRSCRETLPVAIFLDNFIMVLEAVYVTENRAVVAGVSAMFVATASSPSFARGWRNW